MENLNNQQLIQELNNVGYNQENNANNEEIIQIQEAIAVLVNIESDVEDIDMARTALINYIIHNRQQVAGRKGKTKGKKSRKTRGKRSRKTKRSRK